MDTIVDKTLLGPQAGLNDPNNEFGNAVATGDVNNDGFADVGVGCQLCVNGVTHDAGKALVFYGGVDMDTTVDNTFVDPDDTNNDEFGHSLVLTDINRDGFAEVVAGCHRCDNAMVEDSGKFFVFAAAKTPKFNIFNIRVAHDKNTDEITITWKGRSTLAAAQSPLHLEVFNHDSNAWENRFTNSTAAADSDVTLTDTITTNLSDYYESGSNIVHARVFQGPANQILETDLFEMVLGDEAAATIIGDGADPGSVTVAPGDPATEMDAFTLATNVDSDTVTEITTTLATGTFSGISLLEVTSDDGATVYGTSTPTSDVVSTSVVDILITTDPTQFKIRITPKTHLAMSAVPDAEYAVTGIVTSFASTNPQGGADVSSAAITIDNLSPGNVTNATTTPGDQQITVSWDSPGGDFSNVVVLRDTASISGAPDEGSSPSIDEMIGSSTVRFIGINPSFTDTGLTNDVEYFYRIFTKDVHGNYSTLGVEVSDSPATAPAGSGTIEGKVTDADTGRGLRDVVVQIVDTGQSVTTKGNGKYTLSDVPSGSHTVSAFKTDYEGPVEESVTVNMNETAVQDFTLVPG